MPSFGKPKRFRVGSMRHRVVIQEPISDRALTGQKVVTWTNVRTAEPAAHYDVGGGMTFQGQQLQENIKAVFIVRWREGYTTMQRVVHDGQTYGIVAVRLVNGVKRYLTLMCEAVAS